MFFPREEEAPELGPERVKGLRLSLNTPVVTTRELAPGPARAAILVHEERDGRPNITVGLRSLKSGERVLYSFEGDLREHSSLAVAIDAALSFGESMGFLFDDDEVETAGGGEAPLRRAVGLWAELMGESPAAEDGSEAAPDPAAARPRPASGSGEELLLDEVAEASAEAAAEPERPAAGAEADAAPARSPRALSKFRGAKAGAARRAAADRGERGDAGEDGRADRRSAALGRLRLVKRRRRGGGEAAERPHWMLRLLGSF